MVDKLCIGRKDYKNSGFNLTEKLSKLHTKMNYDDVLSYFTGMIRFLIREKVLENRNPELMAANLCLPITVWINLCDREPDREEEVMEMMERHIRQFF